MAQDPKPTGPAQPSSSGYFDRVTFVVLSICVSVESALFLADLNIIEPARLRGLAYAYGGFWPGLLQDWVPNFPGQSALMFVTYGFLHGGPVHLAVNMITLVSLGRLVTDRLSSGGYAVLYVASLLGGALAFALLAPTLRPMVGASGALFGLLGAIVVWEAIERRRAGLTLTPVIRLSALLLILNLVLWWAMEGQLAWETHLGGFVAGALVAYALRPHQDDTSPAP